MAYVKKTKVTDDGVKVANILNNTLNLGIKPMVLTGNNEVDNTTVSAFGNALYSIPNAPNEFLKALVNRISLSRFISKYWESDYNEFDKGFLEVGETVQNIFTDIANVHRFNVDEAETKVFAREIPNVQAEYISINVKGMYIITTQINIMKQAFISVTALNNFIADLIGNAYKSLNYDKFLLTKYLFAKGVLDGYIKLEQVADTGESSTEAVKKRLLDFRFLSTEFNKNGVTTSAKVENEEVFLMSNTAYASAQDVKVLAKAFHKSDVEFLGKQKIINNFHLFSDAPISDVNKKMGDYQRLAELFNTTVDEIKFTAEQLTVLKDIVCVLFDKELLQIYIDTIYMDDIRNPRGGYINSFLHGWFIYALSGFANAIAFTTGTTILPTASGDLPVADIPSTADETVTETETEGTPVERV